MVLLALLELRWVLLQRAQGWVPLAFRPLAQWLAPMLPASCLQQGPSRLVSFRSFRSQTFPGCPNGPRLPRWLQCICKGSNRALRNSSSDKVLFCRQLVCLCTVGSNGRHSAVHCTSDSRHSWHWAGRLLAAQAHMHRSQQGVQQVSQEVSHRGYHPATRRHVKYEQAASVAWKTLTGCQPLYQDIPCCTHHVTVPVLTWVTVSAYSSTSEINCII